MKTKYLKNIYLYMLLACSIFFIGCSDSESEYDYSNITDGNPLKMEVSSQSIILDPNKPNERALIFTWEPGRDRGPNTKITKYIFRLDVADNDFETSITSVEMQEGVYFKSFTSQELNNLLRAKWNRPQDQAIEIEARIIAQVEHPDLYVLPDYSTIKFKVTAYELEPNPLFVVGTATTAGWDPEKSLQMNEVSVDELYNWRGKLSKGELKILKQVTSLFPSYNMGGTEQEMQEVESEEGDNKLFNIPKDGVYSITLNRRSMEIAIEEVKLENVTLGGSATDAGWGVDRIPMEWLPNNPHICEVVTNLKAGEIKFGTVAGTWGSNPVIRPLVADASIQTDLNFIIAVTPDLKWKVNPEEAGRYRISIDIKNQKISFDKIS